MSQLLTLKLALARAGQGVSQTLRQRCHDYTLAFPVADHLREQNHLRPDLLALLSQAFNNCPLQRIDFCDNESTNSTTDIDRARIVTRPNWIAMLHEVGHLATRDYTRELADLMSSANLDSQGPAAQLVFETLANQAVQKALPFVRMFFPVESGIPSNEQFEQWAAMQEQIYAKAAEH